MRRIRLSLAALLLAAAPGAGWAQGTPPAGTYELAPMPNPDIRPPRAPAASNDPSLSPGLFVSPDRFAGDGYTPGSTVQSEQERRLKPGAGFNLRLPFD